MLGRQSYERSQKDPTEGGKDYTAILGTPQQIATRGNSRYMQRVSVYRNQLLNQTLHLLTTVYSVLMQN